MTYEEQMALWKEYNDKMVVENERFTKLLDRWEKFLDNSEAKQPSSVPAIVIESPPGMDEVLEEMAMGGLVTPAQMRKLVESIRPILEENATLKQQQ